MQETTSTLARQIKAESARRGLRLEDVAAAVGMTSQQLSKRMNGHVEFRLRELLAIARCLDVRLSTLTQEAEDAA